MIAGCVPILGTSQRAVVGGNHNIIEYNTISVIRALSSFGIELWGVNNTLVQGNSLDHINNSGILVYSNSDYNVLSENSIDTVINYWILIDTNCLSNTIGKNTYLGTGSVLDKGIGTIYSQ
jgi:parallel beta-helix repeat protein